MRNKKDFLSITDLNTQEIWQVLLIARKIKNLKIAPKYFTNKQMVLLFEKPSLRTKLSFDIGFNQLGGHSLYFGPQEVGLGKREDEADIAKVISTMADIIVARVFNHDQLEILAQNSTVPVVNALSDLEHPCQVLADFLTILEIKDKLEGLTLAFIGDGENNVVNSLVLGCALLGINFNCASPKGYKLKQEIILKAKKINNKIKIFQTNDPKKAVKGADIIYTDTWISMGDEKEQEIRIKKFKKYQVNENLMQIAKADAIFMHDMPAYRNMEVTSEVIDGDRSVVFQQAENRLHVQKALILFLLTEGKYESTRTFTWV